MEEDERAPSPVPGPSSAPDCANGGNDDGGEDEGILRDGDLGVQVKITKDVI